MAWSEEQRANAAVIYRVGLNLGASMRDIQVALMAAIVESGLRNLDYGDRDSIGLFQQRDAWGSREQRLDPASAARMFFLGGNAGQQGLLDIANREQYGLGALAQDVQVSAYPERYAQHQSEAASLLKGIDPAAEVTGAPGTLGAVPGPPVAPVAPAAPPVDSVTEVNGVGEVTADETGIGALTFEDGAAGPQGTPLDALTFGMAPMAADPAQPGGGGQGGGYAPGSGVMMPTLAELGIVQNPDGTYSESATPAGGETFYGQMEGRSPHDVTTIDGETVDFLTAAALSAASEEFGSNFSLMQGGHSDYAASGGTHHGLGVVDLSVPNGDWEGAMIALRKKGFAAWVRNVPGYASAGSGAHIHAVLIGNPQLSPEAQPQVQSYLNNDNGLAGSSPDDGPRDFVNNRFTWGDAPKEDPHDLERQRLARQARSLLGVPHKWGGEDFQGLDDVGLVRKVYKTVGVDVPRLAFTLAYDTNPEPIETAKLGDLIAWDNGSRLGVYAGDGMLIHASGPGGAIQMNYLANLTDPWAISVPKMARRMTYPSGSGGAYTPPTPSAPAPINPEAPASQAPTPSGGGGGGGSNNSGSQNNGGGSNHNDDNWHPTPDGGGYIG